MRRQLYEWFRRKEQEEIVDKNTKALLRAIINFHFLFTEGLNTKGIYRFSLHPMYMSYFICFIGCALLTESWILGGIIFVFQISSHWIILAEERECEKQFGEDYSCYKKEVRRYI